MNPVSESTYFVLLSLYHENLHGYGIIKWIEDGSEGTYSIAPGTLYGVLKNIEKQGLIESIQEDKGSRKKKVYAISPRGKQIVEAEFKRYQSIVYFTEKVMNSEEL